MKVAIGTEIYRDGWTNVNLQEKHPHDVIADVRNLPFLENSVDLVYMSHVLEHFRYRIKGGVTDVLDELFRVTAPGGKVQIGVPDMPTMCRLYLATEGADRIHIMRVIMGGQIDATDEHLTCFDETLLASYLFHAGYRHVKRVTDFGHFKDDCTTLKINDIPISLNMEATKPCST